MTNLFQIISQAGKHRTLPGLIVILTLLLFTGACSEPIADNSTRSPITVSLSVDGEETELVTGGSNVREVLEIAGIDIGESDIVDPAPFTPIESGLAISIIRVTESTEVIEQSVPFQRRSVRNESMSAEDPPLIIQGGKPGLHEITVRIVYHDGLEFSRQETQIREIEPAQEEIVMIGVGAAPGNVEFAGKLAYISGGNSVIVRGSTAFPEQINTGGELDHRVFSLSPTGSYLLFTRSTSDGDGFNSLWLASTERDAEPIPLGIDNVLWANWNPERIGQPQIAYTTGISTDLLPGWEANNDLWLAEIPIDEEDTFDPEQLIEAYPATYGWWGGNYVWSPDGHHIAYSYADEIGVIDVTAEVEDDEPIHSKLIEFTEYNTRSDWVWVPSLTWSPDGRFLAFSIHSGDDPDEAQFDTSALNLEDLSGGRFVIQSGMWSHPQWSPEHSEVFNPDQTTSKIAYLRATDPLDTQRSSYTLWVIDRDGSNAGQIYPAVGENSRFGREQNFMAWGPTGREIAFIYDDRLMILDLDSLEASPVTQDDSIASNPTWAPYGSALGSELVEEIEEDSFRSRPTRTPAPFSSQEDPVD